MNTQEENYFCIVPFQPKHIRAAGIIELQNKKHPWSKEKFEDRTKYIWGIAAMYRGQLAGYLFYDLKRRAGCVNIVNIAVDNHLQRRRIATGCVDALKTKALSNKKRAFLIFVEEENLAAQLFFKKVFANHAYTGRTVTRQIEPDNDLAAEFIQMRYSVVPVKMFSKAEVLANRPIRRY